MWANWVTFARVPFASSRLLLYAPVQSPCGRRSVDGSVQGTIASTVTRSDFCAGASTTRGEPTLYLMLLLDSQAIVVTDGVKAGASAARL